MMRRENEQDDGREFSTVAGGGSPGVPEVGEAGGGAEGGAAAAESGPEPWVFEVPGGGARLEFVGDEPPSAEAVARAIRASGGIPEPLLPEQVEGLPPGVVFSLAGEDGAGHPVVTGAGGRLIDLPENAFPVLTLADERLPMEDRKRVVARYWDEFFRAAGEEQSVARSVSAHFENAYRTLSVAGSMQAMDRVGEDRGGRGISDNIKRLQRIEEMAAAEVARRGEGGEAEPMGMWQRVKEGYLKADRVANEALVALGRNIMGASYRAPVEMPSEARLRSMNAAELEGELLNARMVRKEMEADRTWRRRGGLEDVAARMARFDATQSRGVGQRLAAGAGMLGGAATSPETLVSFGRGQTIRQAMIRGGASASAANVVMNMNVQEAAQQLNAQEGFSLGLFAMDAGAGFAAGAVLGGLGQALVGRFSGRQAKAVEKAVAEANDMPDLVRRVAAATGESEDAVRGMVDATVRDNESLQQAIIRQGLRAGAEGGEEAAGAPAAAVRGAADGAEEAAAPVVRGAADGADAVPVAPPRSAVDFDPSNPPPATGNDLFDVATISERIPAVDLPVGRLKLSKDVPQFKSGADAQGLTEPLGGTFDHRGVGPIQVWQRLNGDLEVISGRHRLDLARRSDEPVILSQVYREADGYDAAWARRLDAELNIRDGQGSVKDFATYFRNTGISEEAAEARGLISRQKGKDGWAIGRDASDDLAAMHASGDITDEAAAQIARAFPGDAGMQRVGVRVYSQTRHIGNSVNAMRAAATRRVADDPGDWFGASDAALNEAMAQAKIATAAQREIAEQINAVRGAVRRPEVAARMGVDVNDPAAVAARVAELEAERVRWNNWYLHRDLVDRVRRDAGVEPLPAEMSLATEAAAPAMARNAAEGETIAAPRGEVVRVDDVHPTLEPLGMERMPVVNRSLENLSDAEFASLQSRVRKNLDRLERRWDEDDLLFEDHAFRKQMGRAQDEYSAMMNERFRRDIRNAEPEDLAFEFRQLNLQSDFDKAKMAVLLDVVRKRNLEEELRPFFEQHAARSPDHREVLSGQLRDAARFVEDLNPRPEPGATVPESPATLAAQMERLGTGERQAVLVPVGTEVPARVPEGARVVEIPEGRVFYNPERIDAAAVRAASSENRLGQVLEYGVDTLPAGENPRAVVVRNAAGTEVQAVAVDDATEAAATAAARRAARADDSVGVEPIERVLAERQAAQAPETAAGGAGGRAAGGGEPPGGGGGGRPPGRGPDEPDLPEPRRGDGAGRDPQIPEGQTRLTDDEVAALPKVERDLIAERPELGTREALAMIRERTRGIVTDADARVRAEELGWTTREVRNIRQGQTLEKSQVVATQGAVMDHTARLAAMRQRLAGMDPGSGEATAMRAAVAAMNVENIRLWQIYRSVAGEAGRTLQSFRMLMEPIDAAMSRVAKVLNDPKVSQDVKDYLIQAVAAADGDAAKVLNLLRTIPRATKMEMFVEMATAMKLAGKQTQLVNITSSIARQLLFPVESLAAAGIDAVESVIRGVPRDRFFSEALAEIVGQVKGYRSVPYHLKRLITDEEYALRLRSADDYYGGRAAAIRGRFGKHTLYDELMNAAGVLIRLPFRILSVGDILVRIPTESGAAYRLATREALSRGHRIGSEDFSRAVAKHIAEPDARMLARIKHDGTKALFQRDVQANILRNIQKIRHDSPWTKLIVPFFRTLNDLVKQAVEWSPAAPVLRGVRQELATKGERADALGRMVVGSVLWFNLVQYAREGNITGRGPRDRAERDAWERIGKKPFSIKIGDRWYNYLRVAPLSYFMASSASMAEALENEDEREAADLAAGFIGEMGQTLINQNFMLGVSDALMALQDPEARASRFFENMIVGATFPNLVAEEARAIDPVIRDVSSDAETRMGQFVERLGNAYKARIPGVSKGLPPQLNVWGQPRMRPEGATDTYWERSWNPIRVSRVHMDVVESALDDLGYVPSFPGRQAFGFPMSNEQYRQFQEVSGDLAYRTLFHLVSTEEWDAMPRNVREDAVERVFRLSRQPARLMAAPENMVDRALRDALREVEGLTRSEAQERVEGVRQEREAAGQSLVPMGAGATE